MKLSRFLLLLLFMTGSVSAAMYKWVDEEGNTHYTQSPPPGDIQGETIAPPPDVDTKQAIQNLKEQQQQSDDYLKQQQDAADVQKKKDEDAARKQANCEMAKKRLASYTEPRVKFVQPDGTRVRATEEERQAEIKKSQDMIDEFCD